MVKLAAVIGSTQAVAIAFGARHGWLAQRRRTVFGGPRRKWKVRAASLVTDQTAERAKAKAFLFTVASAVAAVVGKIQGKIRRRRFGAEQDALGVLNGQFLNVAAVCCCC